MTASYEDAEAVRSTVVAVAHLIDHKRWAELQKLFAAAVRTDYTSLFGGTPEEQKAGALVDGWRGSLGKVATQHLLGPIALHVTGAAARLLSRAGIAPRAGCVRRPDLGGPRTLRVRSCSWDRGMDDHRADAPDLRANGEHEVALRS